jgi:mono/diheme cytochrome c family protein
MTATHRTFWILTLATAAFASAAPARGQEQPKPEQEAAAAKPTAARATDWGEVLRQGKARSSYRGDARPATTDAPRGPDLESFERRVRPILERSCFGCHGPKKQKGDLRLDTLDPDLFGGEDVDWWLDVLAAVSNSEMPPEDEDPLTDADQARVVEWLSNESQRASKARRASSEHTSFRRMSAYEFSYALQDLLGVRYDFTEDLPPDPASEDGFENSSEVLQISSIGFRAYLDAARKALKLATVTGERPAPLSWSVSMKDAAGREWRQQDAQRDGLRKKHKDDPEKLAAEFEKLSKRHRAGANQTHYVERSSGRTARTRWGYNGGKFAWPPSDEPAPMPPPGDTFAHVPPQRGVRLELGDRVPERGTLRVRLRAARAGGGGDRPPRVRLVFGWQASNDSRAHVVLSDADVVVDAPASSPRVYQWDVPIPSIYPRNSVRGVNKMGDLPNPSEYLRFDNASRGGAALLIEHVEVTAPVYDAWPPASHTALFADRAAASEREFARESLLRFLGRAWRRAPTEAELERKLALFDALRAQCETAEAALVEVMAAALASPSFLYVSTDGDGDQLADHELATRLALFLWCSVPDDALLARARSGELRRPEGLDAELTRMLAAPEAARFARRFVRQWLNLALLDYVDIDRKAHPKFDGALHEAMQREPIAFFEEVLRQDLSVLTFVHSDFAMANERLARHYGQDGVVGNELRRVPMRPGARRGGLLTQAGLLAMNSDGTDSHPLKRGIWMLERLLDDPPPPPPAAVPEIDLADPRIAQMTLKERIEDHRNQAACRSCHQKIDPWGIAFENYDAVGSWRDEIKGEPVDAVGVLFNDQRLDGMDGLKRFLLLHRQDQLVRAMVRKLTTFALGRPLTFSDLAAIDEITAEARRRGDGLATMVRTIVSSELFAAR